ncbi:MAG TPA: winged helix-turn-helix transcriptional regulator [Flavobacterium sp.]|nr:winged helix-turn-helix transcriptional regulator [Flavobacterium sp.]
MVKQKPLHIEYYITEKGNSLIPVFKQLEKLTLLTNRQDAIIEE